MEKKKTKRNNYHKKPAFKKGDADGKCEKSKSVAQDWQWYAHMESQASNMASFPFADALGEPIRFSDDGSKIGSGEITMPGIMIHRFIPSIGWQAANTDAGATAADAYFTAMTQGFTGNVDFEAPDALMTALAAANIAMLIAMGKRMHAVMKSAALYNKYETAEILCEACGFNYQDFKGNLANFRTDINNYIAQMNKILVLPKAFSLTERWVQLVSNVFCDDPDINKRKFVLARPAYVLKWSDTIVAQQGTALELVEVPRSMSYDQYFGLLNDLKEALSRQDVRQIFGSIKRVYSEGDLIQFTPLDKDYQLEAVYSKVWLSQFHSMTNVHSSHLNFLVVNEEATDTSVTISNAAVYQMNGRLRSRPVLSYYPQEDDTEIEHKFSLWNAQRLIVDCMDPDVKPTEMLDYTGGMLGMDINTRYQNVKNALPANNTFYALHPRGEIWLESYVAIIQRNSYTGGFKLGFHEYCTFTQFDDVALGPMGDEFFDSYGFNFPAIRYVATSNGTNPRIAQELCNYTTVTQKDICTLNDRCMYQLLALPMNTRSVTK